MADRLISADRFKNWLMENYVLYDGDRSLKDIDAQPTVDAVEVVRCKDCRLSSIECKTKGCVGGVWKTDDKHLFCKITKHLMRVDDFCSWGERRHEDG